MTIGSELWGAFVYLFPSTLSKNCSSWLLGLGDKPSAERLYGWVELRDLSGQATARAVRTLHDARRHGGLLALAIRQLHFKWESARQEITWYGQFLNEVCKVWLTLLRRDFVTSQRSGKVSSRLCHSFYTQLLF